MKPQFTISDRVHLEHNPEASKALNTELHHLGHDIQVNGYFENIHYEINIPKGFLSDGGSIPRLMWWFEPPRGRYDIAYLVHDYLCDYGTVKKNGEDVVLNRSETDILFNEILEWAGMKPSRAGLFYWAVRLHAFAFRLKGPFVEPVKKQWDKYVAMQLKNEGYSK